jgi:hypothetical protein
MKRLIILLLFIPIISYSQKIGKEMPDYLTTQMQIDSREELVVYSDMRKDSSTVIYVEGGRVVGIDYIFDYKYAHDNHFRWLGEFDLVAPNLFRDLDMIYYHVSNDKNKFYIKVRDASKIYIR